MTARQYFPCSPRKMPPQRGQSSRQSPARHFGVGGGRSRQPAVPPLPSPWGRLPSTPLPCPGHRLKRLPGGAGNRDTSSPSGALRPGEPRPARACGGGTGGAPPEGAPAAQSPGEGLAESHPPASGRPRRPRWDFSCSSREGAEVGEGAGRPGKAAFSPDM